VIPLAGKRLLSNAEKHSLNLAAHSGMPHLGEAVFDPVLAANAVEDVREGVRVQGPVGALIISRCLFYFNNLMKIFDNIYTLLSTF
jgi:hypothetical protein